ncbi:hypothetical protein BAE44_0019334 [Dichanthelium oligosanthes]|uniref:[RNA-polymerase]-subunit kinase n=1 Tax=Dichanthelium oligosanthes TaxID=888268 RepID=A0A1E5V3B1_9POAL|nr:hypothetical protein BAE44_0019334 [Dichanthelium oligosanthes]
MAAACVEAAVAAGLARQHAATGPTRVTMGTTDDYEEICCLGEGAFGPVVNARHRATGRAVAMKYLSAPVGGHAVLLREAIFLKACAGNPFVVGFHGLARDPATTELCLVMECGDASLRDARRFPRPWFCDFGLAWPSGRRTRRPARCPTWRPRSCWGSPTTTWPWFSSTTFATDVVPELKDKLLREEFPETMLSKAKEGFEVLSGLLTCNPGKRFTAAAALKHPWFAKMDALELPKKDASPPPKRPRHHL